MLKLKHIICPFFGLCLLGCGNDNSDIVDFIAITKAQHIPRIPPLKSSIEIEHFLYQASLLRSPFVPPLRELTEASIESNKDCMQPNRQRSKGSIETYALDTLKMKGTLQQGDKIWALIQSSDNNVFRLTVGDYLGLYHGKIIQVTSSNIEVVELIPDGSECWTERTSTMELTEK